MEEEDVYSLQAKITQQQSHIKELKKAGIANASDVLVEVNKLNDLRSKLNEMTVGTIINDPFNRKSFDELILRKMYVIQSFEIHNGPAGLFDYGPPACALKSNVLSLWRQFFVLEENMLEMECTNLTPSSVLETSGHVDRFTDFMVRDEITGECFRADKLLEESIDNLLLTNPNMPIQEQEMHKVIQRQADAFSGEELHEMLLKYNIKSPTNPANNLTKPFPFNLMFKTTIGPEGTSVGYLRPETAQGLFVNFRRLLDYNQQKMPFAAAQIGLGFRNEIAPRNGLLRVREFCMAEIEHFVNPSDKSYPKFKNIQDKVLVLFPQEAQLGTGRTIEMTIGEAVRTGIVNNETLGYFMTRTQMWLEKIGVNPLKMRFRQHLKTEMAHYAADCWDMEIKMSYGWIECVGHADRACYDLEQHSQKTGVPMFASMRLPQPIQVEKLIIEPNKKLLGPRFKLDQKEIITGLESLMDEEAGKFKGQMDANNYASLHLIKPLSDGSSEVQITSDLVTFKREKKLMVESKYTPSVIEPSYGIGRILYAVLEHSFSQREGDEQRCVMAFKPCVAPVKVGVFRLINHIPFDPIVNSIKETLLAMNISNRVDSSSGTVGRRYSRADELGIPFGITVDFQTLLDQSVTLRDRDSTAQVRVSIRRVFSLIQNLVHERMAWSTVMQRFPIVRTSDDEVDEAEDEEKEQAKTGGGAANSNNSSSGSAMKVNADVIPVGSTNATKVLYSTRGSFSRPQIPIELKN